MTALVIYDSMYGNTERLARTIADTRNAPAKRVGDVTSSDLEGLTLLVMGSPTQGGRPTKPIQQFLSTLSPDALRDVPVAAFDTRISAADSNFALRALMRVIGYAAPRIDSGLARRGGLSVTSPTGFIVEGREGPLRAGESERAKEWARRLQPGWRCVGIGWRA